MHLMVIGLNHKSAPVEIREKLSFSEERIRESLIGLSKYPAVQERVILSTCNRVEIYVKTDNKKLCVAGITGYLQEYHDIPEDELIDHLYIYGTEDSVRHVFRVASSLDSMVLGEAQILGQVKNAYSLAVDVDATGRFLNQLFEKAFTVTKKIRTDTRISESAVSISFAAVELAKKIFGDLDGKTAMLIGAGEMSELAAKHLVANGVETLLISNRTFDRAVELAKKLGGDAIRYEHMKQELSRADIVISSTGAPDFILLKDDAQRVIKARKNRPVFFIDIAVPRDIDPEVNDIENVYLYNIDDLEDVIEANKKEREKEAVKAEEIVNREVSNFMAWLDSLNAVPTIVSLREKAEEIRKREVDVTLSRLKNLDGEEKKVIESLSKVLVNKLLHQPTVNLKRQAEMSNGFDFIGVVRKLFGLDD